MAREGAFQVEGIVVEVLSKHTFRVELRNKHRVLGYVAKPARASFAGLAVGARVKLAISPYDLSEGRILVEN